MRALRKKYFSMVELALAIAVVSIGMASVVTLVPVSIKAAGKAKSVYYASDIADSINAYITRKLSYDFELLSDLPEKKPSPVLTDTNNWVATGEGNIYNAGGVENGIYGIRIASGDLGNIKDIAGEILIWRNRIGDTVVGENDLVDIGKNKLAGINVEISAPLEKPYSEREIYKFYFETFNRDPVTREMQEEEFETLIGDNDNNIDEIIERNGGEITVTKNAKIKVKIVATELCAGIYHVPVYVRVAVKEPGNEDPEGAVYNCFMGYNFRYGMYGTQTGVSSTELEVAANPGNIWEIDVPLGSTYKVWAAYYNQDVPNLYARYTHKAKPKNKPVHAYWSTNDNQVLTLINDDCPPEFNPDYRQMTPQECIQNYISDEGKVTLNENQVLYLFELSHTTKNLGYWKSFINTGFDMQDMIVLAEITEN